MKINIASALALAAFAAGSVQAQNAVVPVPRPPQGSVEEGHVERARNLARDEFAFIFRRYCTAGGVSQNNEGAAERASLVVPPTRAFDNLYYVGTGSVGAWVLKTSAGLILFDALNDEKEAEAYILRGMKTLGLDPAQIKYIVVMHAHGDHFGGAKFLKARTGARIMMSGADWDHLDAQKAERPAAAGRARRRVDLIPDRDGTIADGAKLTLGDTSVSFFVTPGHTPGTLSALVPLKDGAANHLGGFWGGTLFPTSLEGLRQYDGSLVRFWSAAVSAGADVVLSNHPFLDNTLQHVLEMRGRKGQANPFVIGTARYSTLMGVLDQCNLAAQARMQGK